MTLVVVERGFAEPADVPALVKLEEAVGWCLEQHRVQFLYSYVSRDRRHMVCVYEAPDAEAVRTTQRTGGLPFDQIWSATRITPTGERAEAAERIRSKPGLSTVVVQRALPPGVPVEVVDDALARGFECLRQRKSAPIESFLSDNGLRGVCAYAAPDAESVREANREAAVPMERAWPASRLNP